MSAPKPEIPIVEVTSSALPTLAERVRDLIDAVVHTDAPEADVEAVAAEVERLTARLRATTRQGPTVLARSPWGGHVVASSSVEGVLNPLAPPVTILSEADGEIRARVTFRGCHEGPPGRAHGGWVALVLDHLLGKVSVSAGRPGMTVSVTVAFRRATPYNVPLELVARWDGQDGRKLLASAEMLADGQVTATATGILLPAPAAVNEMMHRSPAPES